MSVALREPPPEVDLDLQKLVLDVQGRKTRGLDTRIENSIVDGTLERTIEGASTLTLTVHDPKRALLQSGMFEHTVDTRLDRLAFRLVKVSKSGDDLTLTFEDREVSLLRQHRKPKKASRAKVTRAEFALSLVREVKPPIRFVCPELHLEQAIAPIPERRQLRQRHEQRQKGLERNAKLTVKGRAADVGQKRNAERVLDVADSLRASTKATLALMEAVIVESTIHNLNYGDADSLGILQVRGSTARSMRIDNRNIEQCCAAFLTRGFTGRGGAMSLVTKNPGWSAGRIAQAVQGSAYPTRYDQVRAEAARFLAAYGMGTDVTQEVSKEYLRIKPYQFRRGGTDGSREDSWTTLQRLAEEVNWRCFMSAGSLYFVSEDRLMQAKSRLVIAEGTPGVSEIDFDVDNGKVRSEVTVTARARRWLAAPGAVVHLEECGPADGRWLVSGIRRGLFDADATITLKRATHKLAEPAPETETETLTTPGSERAYTKSGNDRLDKAYSAARSITNKRLPYVWGGGHAHVGKPDRGSGRDPGIGYDCSGSVCAMLAAARLGFKPGDHAQVSGWFARSWGRAGPGEHLTVYANEIHVFAVFHDVGKKGDQHFGTGDWGKGWRGPGLNPQMHPLGGFTARHWPGT